MGLPNLGYPAYVTIIPTLRRFGKPVIASIAGLSPPDFLEAARAITAVSPDLIEVNLSCPNIQESRKSGTTWKPHARYSWN